MMFVSPPPAVLVLFSGLDESVRQTIGFITLIVVTVLLIIGSVILTRKRK